MTRRQPRGLPAELPGASPGNRRPRSSSAPDKDAPRHQDDPGHEDRPTPQNTEAAPTPSLPHTPPGRRKAPGSDTGSLQRAPPTRGPLRPPRSLSEKWGEPRWERHGARSKAARRRDAFSASGRRANAGDGAVPPQPEGHRGVAASCRVRASHRCARHRFRASSLSESRKTPVRGRTPFLGQAPRRAEAERAPPPTCPQKASAPVSDPGAFLPLPAHRGTIRETRHPPFPCRNCSTIPRVAPVSSSRSR